MLVAHARAHSPLYHDVYRALPASVPVDALPVMTKHALMADFDTLDHRSCDTFFSTSSPRFLADTLAYRRALPEPATSSGKAPGSTGEPGVFVQDDRDAVDLRRAGRGELFWSSLARAGDCVAARMFGGGRAALVAADRRSLREHCLVGACLPARLPASPARGGSQLHGSIARSWSRRSTTLQPAYSRVIRRCWRCSPRSQQGGTAAHPHRRIVWSGGEFLRHPARRLSSRLRSAARC